MTEFAKSCFKNIHQREISTSKLFSLANCGLPDKGINLQCIHQGSGLPS